MAVLVLRRTQPERPRGFRVPLSPWLPILSLICCLVLMASLTVENWIRFFVWMVIGLVIYFSYSRKRSHLRREAGENGKRAADFG
jgi:APA family basic amino acid/polyamine antiporter